MGQKGWKCDNNTPFFLVESKEWVLIYILTLLFFQKIFFVGPKKGKYGKKSGNWKNTQYLLKQSRRWGKLGNKKGMGFKHFLHPIFSILCFFRGSGPGPRICWLTPIQGDWGGQFIWYLHYKQTWIVCSNISINSTLSHHTSYQPTHMWIVTMKVTIVKSIIIWYNVFISITIVKSQSLFYGYITSHNYFTHITSLM